MRRGFLLRLGGTTTTKFKDGTGTPKASENYSHNVTPHPPSPHPTSSSTITRPKQTSPFVNAPAEILLHIFNMALGEGKRLSRYNQRPRELPLPVSFSHISSYVRSVVFGAPLLWTTIDRNVLNSVAMTDAYLIRSQKSLIDVEFDGSYYERPVELFSKLAAHIHRWRRLEFCVDDDMTMEDFRAIVERLRMPSAPNLVHLDVSSIQDSDEDVLEPTFILTRGTPVLKSLYLMSNSLCLPQGVGAVTWFSLHTLPGDMPRLSYGTFCTMLTAMRSLTHLRFIGGITRWPTVKAAKPISLPTLQCLYLNFVEVYETVTVEDYSVSSLFATFTVPSLQQLSINYLPPGILASFLKCLREVIFSFPQVTSLTWWTEMDTKNVTTIVQSFPSLENFTLMDSSFENFVKALVVHDDEPSGLFTLWPCLRRLNFDWVEFTDLREYVSFRIRLKKPIQTVRLKASLRPNKKMSIWTTFVRRLA